jgi:hypothetical protein
VIFLLFAVCPGKTQQLPSLGTEARSPADVRGNPAVGCNLSLVLGTPGNRQPTDSLQRSPTHVNVMPTRYRDLLRSLAGYQRTGVPLVAWVDGAFGPSGGLDDVGSYYLIPKLSAALGISIAAAIDSFYLSLLALALLAGSCGFLVLFRRWSARAVALIGLFLLTGIAYRVGDVYVFFFATAVIAVPWTLVLTLPFTRLFGLRLYLLLIGAIIGIANVVRSHAGTAALIFVCVVVGLHLSAERRQKWVLFVCLGIGLLVPKVFFAHAIAQRNAFLVTRCPEYGSLTAQHPLWHVVYLGLGYLQNDYGIRWDDSVSYEKVQSVKPGTIYGSPEYERILKQEVLMFVRQRPLFVFMTLASKAGVTLVVLLLSANLGLLAVAYHRKSWPVELAFFLAIAFSSLFAIVAYPLPQYMLGLIAFGTLYGITSLGFALESNPGGLRRRQSSSPRREAGPTEIGRAQRTELAVSRAVR